MTIYYVKEENFLFRFSTFTDLENMTGKSRKLMKSSLAASIKHFLPRGEICGRNGAFLKGWTDLNGNPVPSLSKGNYYEDIRKTNKVDIRAK